MPAVVITLPAIGEDPYGAKLLAAINGIVSAFNSSISPDAPRPLASVAVAGTLAGPLAAADHIHPTDGLATVEMLEEAVITGGGTPPSREITAGAGLTGGGTLAADLTLAADFGTAAGTVAEGDDTRIVGAVQADTTAAAATDWLVETQLAADLVRRLGLRTDGTIAMGSAPVAVSNVTGTSTVTVTTATDHNLGTGDIVTIAGVESFTGANGTHTVTWVSDTEVTLDGATGSGTYTTGGTVQRILGGTGAANEGVWNLVQSDTTRDGLVIRGRKGSTKQLAVFRDYRAAVTVAIGPLGGAGVISGDPNDILYTTDGPFGRRFAASTSGGVRMAAGDPAGSVGALALGNADTAPTGNPDGSHLGEGAFVTAAGVVLWAKDGRLFARTSTGHTDELTFPSRRITWGIHASGSANTFQTLLCPAPTLSQADPGGGGADRPDGNFAFFTTTTTSGNVGGVNSANYTHTRAQTAPTLYAKLATDNTSVASTRYVAGLVTADRSGGAGPASSGASSATGIYLRYDSGIDVTAFWRAVTCDGTNATVTTTTAAIAASAGYELRIEVNTAITSVRFWVGDVLVATHTTNIPAGSTQLGYQVTVTTLTTAAKQLRVSRVLVNQE
jgi:hypothetical protein